MIRAASHTCFAANGGRGDKTEKPNTVLSLMETKTAAEPEKRQTAADESRSSSSPSSASSRKRSAHTDSEDANDAAFEQLHINTGGSLSSDGSRDSICLCTPAPKIPRPRNVFILYRQHHQSQVTAENPKLSNPDISKIIGQKWKDERDDVKEKWKTLAEEEKQRHQLQYPDYRYQPRRGTKGLTNKGGPAAVADDNERCPRCHGRIIMTPRTPATPFDSAAPASRPDVDRVGPSGYAGYAVDVSRRHSIERFPPTRTPFSGQLPPVRGIDDGEPISPEMKRRRTNGAGHYHMVSSAGGYDMPYGRRQSGEFLRGPPDGRPYSPARSYARSALPGPGGALRPPMAPPPRPPMAGGWAEQGHPTNRRRTFDESVRLPPLQTSIPQAPARTPLVDSRYLQTPTTSSSTASNSQATPSRSLEAQIMALPLAKKLEVLARVCQPLPVAACPDLPDIEARGAFIVVEGADAVMLSAVGQVVEKVLESIDDVALKTWSDDASGPSGASHSESRSEYLRTVMQWQGKSDQVEAYISRRHQDPHGTEEDANAAERRSSTGEVQGKTRVALASDGFSLTLSDRFAVATRFRDTYAPVDHWQWMASMWRGTLCPDLVVYAKPASEDEVNRFGTVEFLKGMGLLVVRGAWRDTIDEATERRLSFEVAEWVREGSFREEKPGNWRHE